MNSDDLRGIVSVRTQVPEQAMTADVLGQERQGHGVVFSNDGLVLTVGYLVTEAETIWVVDASGTAVSASLLGYDQTTGLAVVQMLGNLDVPALELGNSADLAVGQKMIMVGCGGAEQVIDTELCEVGEFAGYWEYLLEQALFTEPAHPDWGGAALVGQDGFLYGIGSLLLQPENDEGEARNMIIPIDLFHASRSELLARAQPASPRPWLGWYIRNSSNGPIVLGTVDSAPAEQAGVVAGDVVVAVNGQRVHSINDTFRKIWGTGAAGVSVDLALRREDALRVITVQSVDRSAMLWRPVLH